MQAFLPWPPRWPHVPPPGTGSYWTLGIAGVNHLGLLLYSDFWQLKSYNSQNQSPDTETQLGKRQFPMTATPSSPSFIHSSSAARHISSICRIQIVLRLAVASQRSCYDMALANKSKYIYFYLLIYIYSKFFFDHFLATAATRVREQLLGFKDLNYST